MEVYILFVHIYLRAAVSVAGEQNPQTKADEMKDVRLIPTAWFSGFFPVSLDVGHPALLARLPLPGVLPLKRMLTWSGGPPGPAQMCSQPGHVTVSLSLQVMTPGLYCYYSTELAFYWSLVFSQFTDIKRKVRRTGVVSVFGRSHGLWKRVPCHVTEWA